MRTLTLILLALIAACGGGGGSSGGGIPDPGNNPPPGPQFGNLSGSISVFIPQQENIVEKEPNDTQFQAHSLGEMLPGRTVSLVGHVRADNDEDGVDAFRIVARERVKITMTLEWQGAGDPDFAVGVWDFIAQQHVEFFEGGSSPLQGEFHVKGVVALIVSVLQGEGDYVMTLTADAAATKIDERELDNEFFYFGQFLGEVLDGDRVTVQGKGHYILDQWDSVAISCPEAITLDLTCHIPTTGLPEDGEYDIYVYDITGGEEEPPEIGAFIWDGQAARGEVDIPAGTLVQVFVFAFAGNATYNLTVRGDPPREGMQTTRTISTKLAFPGARAPDVAPPFVTGQAIVLPGPDKAAFEKKMRELGCTVTSAIPNGPCCVCFDTPAFGERRFTARMLACLSRSAAVRLAEPNYLRTLHAEPDDTNYPLQWHYRTMGFDRAWDITTGDNSIIVAVLDTGKTEHPDLENRQIDGYDFVDRNSNARDGDGPDPDPTDEGSLRNNGFHGSHVAGTIAAQTDNNFGVAGGTWSTRVLHVRVCGIRDCTDFSLINGIRYAAGLENASGTTPDEPARIINMSLGGPGFSQSIQDACTAARDAGVTIFASSGNAGNTTPQYPAANEGVISVGSISVSKTRVNYSSYGNWLDLVATGGDTTKDDNADGHPDGVLSTIYNDLAAQPYYTYAFYQGTSMACPHACAAAALMLAVDPTLTPDDIEDILKSTAEDLGDEGFDDEYGFGMVDAFRAVEAVRGVEPEVPPLLGLTATTLSFAQQETTERVGIANVGGQKLLVSAVTVVTRPGEDWLSALAIPSASETVDTSAIDITVDRTGLADGAYFGRVQVESNGGTLQILVLLNVESGPSAPPDIEVIVRAVNVDTGEVVREDFVNPSRTLDFSLTDLPEGTYRLMAGTDLNNNGILGEPGELIGVYPHTDSPILIKVSGGDDRGPFEFIVSPSGILAGK